MSDTSGSAWSEAHNAGLLHRLSGQSTLPIVIGDTSFDLTLYASHVSMHKVPAFWRFHRVHHADTEHATSTSGLRQHAVRAADVALTCSPSVAPVLGNFEGEQQPETDSHYGCVFSVWDRLFGTTRKTQIEAISFGLERYREPNDQTVWKLLKMPFGRL